MVQDILDRLSIDAGQRTLGQLIQEREAAAQEIRRLRERVQSLTARRADAGTPVQHPRPPTPQAERPALRPGVLIRRAEVQKIVGMSNASIYRHTREGTFPPPIRVSERSVRWRSDDLIAWLDSLTREK